MTQWQPIETAPKDGTKILAYGETQYGPKEQNIGVAYWWDGHWLGGNFRSRCEPSHWMPLPEPPTKD